MENYGYYPDDEEVVEKGFSFGKLIKYIATAFVIAIWVIVLFRIWVSGETKFSKSFMWTPESIAAYKESPDDFKILQYELKSYTKHFENPDGSLSAQQLLQRRRKTNLVRIQLVFVPPFFRERWHFLVRIQ